MREVIVATISDMSQLFQYVTAAPDQARVGHRVVRRAVGRRLHESAVARQHARGAVDARHFERLCTREARQEAGRTPREHGLAAAGRPDHQQVVAARQGDFQRTFRLRLPANVEQVQQRFRVRFRRRCGRREEEARAVQVLHGRAEVRGAVHGHRVDQGGLARTGRGQQAPRSPTAHREAETAKAHRG